VNGDRQYAASGDHFPGSLGHGQTAQTVRVPEILAEANVGKPAVGRADKPIRTRKTGRHGLLADQQLVSSNYSQCPRLASCAEGRAHVVDN
jgi:hypothetical protein